MKRYSLFIMAAILLIFIPKLYAWTPEIKTAIQAVADGTATPQQEALAFRSNREVNMMAEQGVIPKEVYVKAQNSYAQKMQEIMKNAAHDAGVGFEMQTSDPNKLPQPGTDVDGHIVPSLDNPNQQLTARDVANVRQGINDGVNTYLQENDLEPLENPSKQLSADAMPAKGFTPQEEAAASNYINREGGTAYRDPVAASVESYLRGDPVQKPSLVDYARYVSEQQRQIMAHNNTNELTDEMSKASDAQKGAQEWIDAQNNKGQVQLEAEQTGKYQNRINKSAAALGDEFGVPVEQPDTIGRTASEIVAAQRGPATEPIAAMVDSLRDNTTLRNTDSFVDTVARLARGNPDMRGQANEAIAEATRNFTPAERGAVLERIDNDPTLGGRQAAEELAKAMRDNSVPDTAEQLNSKLTRSAQTENGAPPSGAGPEAGSSNVVSAVDEGVGNMLGVGKLGADASVARQAANTAAEGAGGVMTVVGLALTAKQVGQDAGEYVEGISRGMNSKTTDKEANQAFQQAHDAAVDTASAGTLGAAAAVSPVIIGGALTGIGAYRGTRYILENTQTGKKFDAKVLNGMDYLMWAAECDAKWFKGILGMQTQKDRDELLARKRAEALNRKNIPVKTDKIKPPKGQPEDGYGVFLLTNASNGLFIGTEKSLKTRRACGFEGGGNCVGESVEDNPVVTYQKLLGPYSTRKDAEEMFCQAIKGHTVVSVSGTRVKWLGDEKTLYGLFDGSTDVNCDGK